jgi:hypothetical protein
MKFNDACLKLNIKYPFSKKQLTKAYHILALKYHPDKQSEINKKEIYTKKFQEINEAYEFLNKIIENDDVNDDVNANFSFEKNSFSYNFLFENFVQSIFNKNEIEMDVQKILNILLTNCEKISIKLFEKMDKETCIKIYQFIVNYYHIFNIPNETVEKIKEILNKKVENDNIFILNPNLNDLLNDNIFVLEFEDEKYYVPLWHDELYYKHKNNDLLIKCIPDLPENIELDDNNNLLMTIYFKLNDIIDKDEIEFEIEDKKFIINTDELKLKRIQTYIFKNKGISIINSSNVYDNNYKSNLIIKIYLQ